MSHFHYITPPDTYCPACRRDLTTPDAITAHDISCAEDGERSYRCAVNVSARTVRAAKMVQGASAHVKPSVQ